MLGKAKKLLGIESERAEVPKNSKPAINGITSSQKKTSTPDSTREIDLTAPAQATKPAIGHSQPVVGSSVKANGALATVKQAAKSSPSAQVMPKPENRSIPTKGIESKPKQPTAFASTNAGKKRGNRKPKNTRTVSLQMPRTLIRVLDEIVEVGAYRNRSDLMLQAIRTYPVIDERLRLLKSKQVQQKK